MTTTILSDARDYLVTFLRGKPNVRETKHPWHKGWIHVVLHSLRVESYVLRILAHEEHRLTESDLRSLQLAAILHDIGRLEKSENHSKTGAEITRLWLENHQDRNLKEADIIRIVELIADHSNKVGHEPDFCKAVLKDADILDEIGAMSIFMASNWLDLPSPFFFYDLQKRLLDFEIPFCDHQLMYVNTNAAKEILNKKKAFIEHFVVQLSDELQVDPEIKSSLLASR